MTVNDRLQRAVATNGLVRIRFCGEPFDGIVVALSSELVHLADIDEGIRQNGNTILRVTHISEVRSPHPYEARYEKVLRTRQQREVRVPRLELKSMHGVIAALGRVFPLVSLHSDPTDPGLCIMGKVKLVDSTTAVVREIEPSGHWKPLDTEVPIATISRVDAGGAYEQALSIGAQGDL